MFDDESSRGIMMLRRWLVVLVVVTGAMSSEIGERRLRNLRRKAQESPNGIIKLSASDFKSGRRRREYVMGYPRPYEMVIYFSADSSELSKELFPEFVYMVDLYHQAGIHQAEWPTFFAQLNYDTAVGEIFAMVRPTTQFEFRTAPNLVVSQAEMALVPPSERKLYLQNFKWSISYSEGHVTTHKMLDFVNKRTGHDVVYKPTLKNMLIVRQSRQIFFSFVGVAFLGVVAFIKLKFLWVDWRVWFVGSIVRRTTQLISVICCSGVVYNVIHEVPFYNQDSKTGETIIFSGGNREQLGAQGLIVSLMFLTVGLIFIGLATYAHKTHSLLGVTLAFLALALAFFILKTLEELYSAKGEYRPDFFPPSQYKRGPLSVDQGNNI